MRTKDSRYLDTPGFVSDPGQGQVFQGLRPRRIGPATGVLEHTLVMGDRLDLLALHYYNDPRKGWRILDANPEFLAELLDGRDAEALVGKILLVPAVEEMEIR